MTPLFLSSNSLTSLEELEQSNIFSESEPVGTQLRCDRLVLVLVSCETSEASRMKIGVTELELCSGGTVGGVAI